MTRKIVDFCEITCAHSKALSHLSTKFLSEKKSFFTVKRSEGVKLLFSLWNFTNSKRLYRVDAFFFFFVDVRFKVIMQREVSPFCNNFSAVDVSLSFFFFLSPFHRIFDEKYTIGTKIIQDGTKFSYANSNATGCFLNMCFSTSFVTYENKNASATYEAYVSRHVFRSKSAWISTRSNKTKVF